MTQDPEISSSSTPHHERITCDCKPFDINKFAKQRCYLHLNLKSKSFITSTMTTLNPITSTSELESHTKTLPPTALLVLYFHASWAAPCAQVSTVLSTLASTYPAVHPPTISFLSIDTDAAPDLAEAHDVSAVPFIHLSRNSETLDTVSGSDAAAIRAAIEKHSKQADALQLPPAQKVTRPEQQAPASGDSNGNANGLARYAPDAKAPATAPEYSSETKPSLGTSTQDAAKDGPADIDERLKQLTNAAPVMLFMKGTPSAPQCGFSRQLVSILRDQGVRYGFFNILADDEVRQGLKEYADWPTFPQLWLSGELIGGLDILREELEGNEGFLDEFKAEGKRGGPGMKT